MPTNLVIRKRSAKEWMEDSNIEILRGIALQCMTYEDIADRIGITRQALHMWRNKYPEIRDAIEITRDEADSVVISTTFSSVLRGDPAANDRWWKYRIAPKIDKDENGTETIRVVRIVDDV